MIFLTDLKLLRCKYMQAENTSTVYEGNIANNTVTSKGASTAQGDRLLDITDVTASDTNYLIVKLGIASITEFRGGYITLVAV